MPSPRPLPKPATSQGEQLPIPYLYTVDFIAKSDPITDVSINIREGKFPNSGPRNTEDVLLGRHEAIEQELRRFSSIWDELKPPLAIRHLIETEIAVVPDEVGPPIAIIELDETGLNWISEGQCAPH